MFTWKGRHIVLALFAGYIHRVPTGDQFRKIYEASHHEVLFP